MPTSMAETCRTTTVLPLVARNCWTHSYCHGSSTTHPHGAPADCSPGAREPSAGPARARPPRVHRSRRPRLGPHQARPARPRRLSTGLERDWPKRSPPRLNVRPADAGSGVMASGSGQRRDQEPLTRVHLRGVQLVGELDPGNSLVDRQARQLGCGYLGEGLVGENRCGVVDL